VETTIPVVVIEEQKHKETIVTTIMETTTIQEIVIETITIGEMITGGIYLVVMNVLGVETKERLEQYLD
jgi:hypothetical protein